MNILIDTNILLWLLLSSNRLSKKLQCSLTEAESLHVSIVSLWEISLKKSAKGFGDLDLPDDWISVFQKALEKFQINILTINIDSCDHLQSLPFHHKDPFDRMIISQAMENKLAVMTSDKHFQKYDVKVIR